MADYISREAALNLIDRYWQQAYNAHFLDAAVRLGSVYREMEDLPAADVREVKRGRWIDTDNYYQRWKCSACGCHTRDAVPNFCPNCGAWMEES